MQQEACEKHYYLSYDLQLFAKEGQDGEKTEEPQPKSWRMPARRDRLCEVPRWLPQQRFSHFSLCLRFLSDLSATGL